MRHRITNDEYIQVLECAKDSVFTEYSSDKESSYQGHKTIVDHVRGQDINEYDTIEDDIKSGRRTGF